MRGSWQKLTPPPLPWCLLEATTPCKMGFLPECRFAQQRGGTLKLSHRTPLKGELRAGSPVWDSLSTPSVWLGNNDNSLRLIFKDIKEGKELSKLAFRLGRNDPSWLVVGNREVSDCAANSACGFPRATLGVLQADSNPLRGLFISNVKR